MSRTVFALTSTETSDGGRLTRQFLSDCCRTTSAWTTLAAGFLGGIAREDGGEVENAECRLRQLFPPSAASLSPRAEVVGAGDPQAVAGGGRRQMAAPSNRSTALETRVDAPSKQRAQPDFATAHPPRCNCPRDITQHTRPTAFF
jgi:hypothetical protein